MVGLIENAIAETLKGWKQLIEANVMPIRATEGDTVVVNTTLPAIAIQLTAKEGQTAPFIGGDIRLYYDLHLHVIIAVNNTAFSFDGGVQAKQLDISDTVISCMELSKGLDEVKQMIDMNVQYQSMETSNTYGTMGAQSINAQVHTITYHVDVAFTPTGEGADDYVILENINFIQE